MARVMVAVANKESRDKARRVAAARERQAVAGEFGGGWRRYGFDADGVTIRADEAKVIEDCTIRCVQGASLRSLAADLRTRGVTTVTGAKWTAVRLREVLLRPRNAGRMVYRGEEIGDAPWDPIVPVDTFRALQQKLADPHRRTSGAGAAPRWLGSGLFCCGICTDAHFTHRVGMQVRIGGRQPAYRCSAANHLVRAAKHVNALVESTILERLAREDAVDLLPSAAPDVDVKGLRTEAAAIRDGLNELAADKALGLIDRAQLIAGTQRGKARLAEIEQVLQVATVESPLAPLIGAEDVAAVWQGLTLAHQRLVIDELVTVRILPVGRRGRTFDVAGVEIRWRDQHRGAEAE
jgi:hypothetical protein